MSNIKKTLDSIDFETETKINEVITKHGKLIEKELDKLGIKNRGVFMMACKPSEKYGNYSTNMSDEFIKDELKKILKGLESQTTVTLPIKH